MIIRFDFTTLAETNQQLLFIQCNSRACKAEPRNYSSRTACMHRNSKSQNSFDNDNDNDNDDNDFITAFPTYRRLFVCNNKLATLSTLKKRKKNKNIYIYITSIYN